MRNYKDKRTATEMITIRFYSMLLWVLVPYLMSSQPEWQNVPVASSASFRGISAVSPTTCWISGSNGEVWLTQNAGESWKEVSPEGYQSLQFRDIEAFDDRTALILSAGLPAVILRTTDAGTSWEEVYRNEQEGIFFDAMDFCDSLNAFAFSDAPAKKVLLIRTNDGGRSWQTADTTAMPEVSYRQGGFAASGSCIQCFSNKKVIIGLGGEQASILLSRDMGSTWTLTSAPLDYGQPSKGIFSFSFIDSLNGICVGGDYLGDSLTASNMAITSDGGLLWKAVKSKEAGKYRSAVIWIDSYRIISISRTGCSWSSDAGNTWSSCEGNFYSLSMAGRSIWASGDNGRIARWVME